MFYIQNITESSVILLNHLLASLDHYTLVAFANLLTSEVEDRSIVSSRCCDVGDAGRSARYNFLGRENLWSTLEDSTIETSCGVSFTLCEFCNAVQVAASLKSPSLEVAEETPGRLGNKVL